MVYAAYALAFWYGIHLFARGEARSSRCVITTLFSINIGTNALSQLATYLGYFFRIFSPGREHFNVIDDKSTVDNRSLPYNNDASFSCPGFTPRLRGSDIKFMNVNFCYPIPPTVPVLKNFCLQIESGKTTALIGPGGSGKSTILGLIERWYDIIDGGVFIGGLKLNDIPLDELRWEIRIVQQV